MPFDEESIEVTMDDFVNGLREITPPFGASTYELERCRFVSHSNMSFKEFLLDDLYV